MVQAPAGFSGQFRSDLEARALYSEGAGIFRIIPAAVAAPGGPSDLLTLLKWACDTGTPLVPRGAGSGMPGHNVGAGVVLDLRRAFRRQLMVSASSRTVQASADCTWREINDAAGAHGLRLPPDPSSGSFCTLGGMLATNAAGSRSLKYGAIREWVDWLYFWTAEGERNFACAPDKPQSGEPTVAEQSALAVRFDPALAAAGPSALTRKNSSGYCLRGLHEGDLRHLLIGSEGTLALIDYATLRLIPLPAERQTLLVTLGDLDRIGPAVQALAEHDPAAVELLDRTWLDFVRAASHGHVPSGTEAVLIVEIEGDAGPAADAVRHLATGILREDDPVAAGRLWETRHLASPMLASLPDNMRSLQVIEDGCVPRERLAEYIASLRSLGAAHEFEIVIFGHAGDGHVHANVLADTSRPDVAERLGSLLIAASAEQIRLGGTLSGEHGDGRLRAPFVEGRFGAAWMETCRSLKAAFDPHGILNPGVKLPAADALPGLRPSELKVGHDAPALPARVAAELRRIEREAAWGQDRLATTGGSPPA